MKKLNTLAMNPNLRRLNTDYYSSMRIQEHKEIFTEVLTTLSSGLILNLKKCRFHIILQSECTHRLNEAHLKAISNFLVPTISKETRRCYFFSYSRRFADFARIVSSLYKLKRNYTVLEWTEECMKAILYL